MRLDELFGSGTMSVSAQLRQTAMDLLTPMAAHKLPFITIQQVIDELRQQRPGILVDRALVMDLLDPGKVGMVKKIEGDRVYLQMPEGEERATTPDDEEREKERISDKAQDQAMKAVKQ